MPFSFNSLRIPKQTRPFDGPLDHPNDSTTSLANKRSSSTFQLTRTKSFLSKLRIPTSETRGNLQSKRESLDPSPSERLVHRSDNLATPSIRPSQSSVTSVNPPLNTLSSIIMESNLETRAINSMHLARSMWRRERIQAWRKSSASLSAPYPDEDGLTPFKGLDSSPAQRPPLPLYFQDKDQKLEPDKPVTLAALYEPADALLKCLLVDSENLLEKSAPHTVIKKAEAEVQVRLEIRVNEPAEGSKTFSRPAIPAAFLAAHKPLEPSTATAVTVRPLATARKGSRQRRTGGGPSKNRYLTQLVARSSNRIRSKRTSIQDREGSFACSLIPPESTLIVYKPLTTDSCNSINIEVGNSWTKTVNCKDPTTRKKFLSSPSIILDAFKEALPGFHEPLTTSVSASLSCSSSFTKAMKLSQMAADFLTVDACYVDGSDYSTRKDGSEGGMLMMAKSYSSDPMNEKRDRRSRRCRSLGFNEGSWISERAGLALMDDVV